MNREATIVSGLTLELLRMSHAAEIIAFEQENRAFFAQSVPDRGDDYFILENMERFLTAIEAEQARGDSFLYLVRDQSGQLVGRVNLVDVQAGTASLGYRIGAKHGGKGYATEAVRLALAEATSRGIRRVTAMTTLENVGSQTVLRRNGFAVTEGRPDALDVNGRLLPAIHFERNLA